MTDNEEKFSELLSHIFSWGPKVEMKSVEGTIFKVIMDFHFLKSSKNYQSTKFKI